MFKHLAAFGLLVAGVSQGEPRMAVLASGDCRDPDLLADTRALSAEINTQRKGHVLEEDEIRDKLAPQARGSAEDLARQVDAAQMQFWHAQYQKAEAAISATLQEIRRLPAGPERWKLTATAEVLYGLTLRALSRSDQSVEAFRRVLRLAPKHRLDPDFYSPSTRARFGKVLEDMAKLRRVHLEVTSIPSGADVFLDGLNVGKTPYRSEVFPGSYEVVLQKDQATSLPHLEQITADTRLQMDLQFEGAIRLERTPCFSSREDEKLRLATALKLATLLGVEDIVVLRLERPNAGPSWLAATVLNVQSAQKLREGGLKVRSSTQEPEGLAELATFILTGQVGKTVLPVESSPRHLAGAPATAQLGKAVPQAEHGEKRPSPRVALAPSLAAMTESTPQTWKTPAGLGAAGAGVLALGAGVLFQLQSAASWTRFNGFYEGGVAPTPGQLPSAVQLRDQAAAQQTLSIVGYILGATCLAGGATLYLLDGRLPGTTSKPADAGSLRLQVLPGGATLSMALP